MSASVPEHFLSVLQVSNSVMSYLRPGAHQGPPGALRTNQLSPISSGGFLLFSTWILLGVSLLLLDNLSRNVHAEVSMLPSSPVLPNPPWLKDWDLAFGHCDSDVKLPWLKAI